MQRMSLKGWTFTAITITGLFVINDPVLAEKQSKSFTWEGYNGEGSVTVTCTGTQAEMAAQSVELDCFTATWRNLRKVCTESGDKTSCTNFALLSRPIPAPAPSRASSSQVIRDAQLSTSQGIIDSTIGTVTRGLTNLLVGEINDITGLSVASKIVEYNGQNIDFEYQRWKVKLDSVCHKHKGEVTGYSTCSVAAKAFFIDACKQLKAKPIPGWKYPKLHQLYCDAAVRYKPTYGTITRANPTHPPLTPLKPTQLSELDEAREECSLLTLEARDTLDAGVIARRDRACEKYQSLRASKGK